MLGLLILLSVNTVLVSAQNIPVSTQGVPLFVLNEVFVVDEQFTTPDYQQIRENFAKIEGKLAKSEQENSFSFGSLAVQLPVFVSLMVVLVVLSVVYYKTVNKTLGSDQRDIEAEIFTLPHNNQVENETKVCSLPCDNPGFQGSKESVYTVQANAKQASGSQDGTVMVEKLRTSVRNDSVHVSKSLYI